MTHKIVEADSRMIVVKPNVTRAHEHMMSKFVMFKVAGTE